MEMKVKKEKKEMKEKMEKKEKRKSENDLEKSDGRSSKRAKDSPS